MVVGGGIGRRLDAYHLAHLGETDVLLLEQGTLSCGTTWHAAGLVGLLRASESGTRLVQYSAQLYQRLEAETGLVTGYKQCGGLIVARTDDRMRACVVRRRRPPPTTSSASCSPPSRRGERYPLLRTDDLAGAIWLPGDGTANPTDTTQALAKGARSGVAVRTGAGHGFDVVADPAAPADAGTVCAPTPATSSARSSVNWPASGPRRSAPWRVSGCLCTPPSTSTS